MMPCTFVLTGSLVRAMLLDRSDGTLFSSSSSLCVSVYLSVCLPVCLLLSVCLSVSLKWIKPYHYPKNKTAKLEKQNKQKTQKTGAAD